MTTTLAEIVHFKNDRASIFLTPPFSDEPLYPQKVCAKRFECGFLKEELPLFDLGDELSEEESSSKVDIISHLDAHSMVGTVCCKIFDNLSDLELLRASHVNSTWRVVIRYSDMKSGRRVSRYLKKMKRFSQVNKENSFCQETKLLPSCSRSPLTSVNTSKNTAVQIANQSLHTSRTPSDQPLDATGKYCQCPECQSPARITYKKTGHCSKCDTSFCIHCFYSKDKHSPNCQLIGGETGSPRKLTMKNNRRYSLGSKDNRNRLKRL